MPETRKGQTSVQCFTHVPIYSQLGLTIVEWNRLDYNVAKLLIMFLEAICLRLSDPCQKPTYNCHYYNICKTLLDDLNVVHVNISKPSETALIDLLIHEEASFNKIDTKMILTAYQIYSRFW